MGAGRGEFVTRQLLSTVVEIAGIVAIIVGCSLIAAWLGWIVGGLGAVLIGLSIDPPRGRSSQ